MDISLALEQQFDHLKNRVMRVTSAMYLSPQDAEDAVQDVCVYILENQVAPDQWGKAITTVCGKARTDRHRAKKRMVSLSSMAD
jgi:DNA-directed RNA polymerase specialized sigma24 family protein